MNNGRDNVTSRTVSGVCGASSWCKRTDSAPPPSLHEVFRTSQAQSKRYSAVRIPGNLAPVIPGGIHAVAASDNESALFGCVVKIPGNPLDGAWSCGTGQFERAGGLVWNPSNVIGFRSAVDLSKKRPSVGGCRSGASGSPLSGLVGDSCTLQERP